MPDPVLIGEVLRRMGYRREVERPACRAPGCSREADGLDGFCAPCSRDRERSGRWETIPLLEEEEN